MAMNIIFCADGTWNGPDQDDDRDRSVGPTNVYKLFLAIEGELEPDSLIHADEQEKGMIVGGETRQASKYIHGVGDSRNPIVKLMGGAFGAGIISRIVRGYTFISRNYSGAEDRIFIVGFSRGAYTARALAGLIASQGLLSPELTKDKEQAYRKGAEAWYRYRKETVPGPFGLARLTEVATDLPAFISCSSLRDADLVPVGRIASVAVWDTVGALGIPEYIAKGGRGDAFRFADTKLSPKVASGFHAVALDERRCDFTPTLWDASDNVTQVLFPGAHADVGGGYPMENGESGLSDGALKWMVERLESAGVVFSGTHPYPVAPDPAGVAHEPWKHGHWRTAERSLPEGTPEHPSVEDRRAAGNVVPDPGEPPAPYRPTAGPGQPEGPKM